MFDADMAPPLRDRWVERMLWQERREHAMRAKFFVDHVSHYSHSRQVSMRAVYDGSTENNQFALATPSGEVTMTISNPDAFDFLEPGKCYYLDFTKAPD